VPCGHQCKDHVLATGVRAASLQSYSTWADARGTWRPVTGHGVACRVGQECELSRTVTDSER
jgi:hypothetical protein